MRPPALLAALLLLGAACGQIERARASDEVEVLFDQPSVPGSDHPRHRFDLFLPRGKSGFPLLVFIHGGYWRGGDRRYFQFATGLYGNVGLALAREGIATAVISYRLSPEVAIDAMLGDVAAAVRAAHDRALLRGAAEGQLFLAGHSAGGHLAALLSCDREPLRRASVDPGWLRGVVALSPVLDLPHLRAHQDAAFNAEVTDRLFAPLTRLSAWSPAQRCAGDEVPWLVLYGDRDLPYLLEQIPQAAEALRRRGASVELAALEGLEHSDLVLRVDGRRDPVTPRVVAFVRQRLLAR